MINVIETSFQWHGELNLTNNPDTIILHHAEAKSCTVLDIDDWHKQRGWVGIGYQYFVRKNGLIYRGRPEAAVGAHTIPYNGNSVGICAEGDYEFDDMPDIQKLAIIALEQDVMARHKILNIFGHGEVWPTACPGKKYPMTSIKAGAYNKVVAAAPVQPKVVYVAKENVEVLQALCNKLGVRDAYGRSLIVDGKAGPNTQYAVAHLPVCGMKYTHPEATRYIQTKLNHLGYTNKAGTSLKVDGVFWTNTDEALKKFQRAYGLTIDGICGGATWTMFMNL